MDNYIRKLTHDNEQMSKQWSHIFDKLHELWYNTSDIDQVNVKVKSLDALVDYILADNQDTDQIKITFLQITMENFINEPLPPINDLVRIFCRILEVLDENNLLQLTFLQKFFYLFRIAERLSDPLSINLIEKIFSYFQKHEFLNKNFRNDMKRNWITFLGEQAFSALSCDSNKFNLEEIMFNMRAQFQELYRFTARHSHESEVWKEVQDNLKRTFPTIFHSFLKPDHAILHLNASVEPPVSRDYVELLAEAYGNQIDLIKKNLSEIYKALEKLLIQDKIDEFEIFLDRIILPHFSKIIDINQFIEVSIHLCSIVKQETRISFCKTFISPISYEFSQNNFPKKYAGKFFDFILAIVNLNISTAPICAYRIIEISEFYSWKQLEKQITQLIQLCINYDQIDDDDDNSSSSKYEGLTSIIELIHERAKVNITLYNATHDLALQAILKWSSIINNHTGKQYGLHVFQMGHELTKLINPKKINIDTCICFIDILQKRIDNNDDEENNTRDIDQFLDSIANLLSLSIENLKNLPIILHEKLAHYFRTSFDCPFQQENGNPTFSNLTCTYLWFNVIQCLNNEKHAQLYESCTDRLYDLIYNENEENLYSWWTEFWTTIGTKYPNIAVNHITQFLEDVLDHKQLYLIVLLPLLYTKKPEEYHARLDDIIHRLFENNGENLLSLFSILTPIAKIHPEIFKSDQIDYILTSVKTLRNTHNQLYIVYQTLGYIANAQPNLFTKYKDKFINSIINDKNEYVFVCLEQYLVASTILEGENKVDESLNILINLLNKLNKHSNDLSTKILHTCQLIGIRNKQILATKRKDLIKFKSNSTCQMLIDLIDGNKMSEENQAIMNRTLDEITQIEQRVVHNERDVKNLTKTVKRQELNITNLDNRVDIVETNVNNLTEQVDYQKNEIERIDAKTLSYVPSEWGHDVCKLLNIRSDNDWRLLGKRFGYSTSELRHWSMQLDPSMSLLNEWFMTHKADEATYGLVKMLKEIGRNDCEKIIRKAVLASGELIPDDLPMEIKRLPPVFLSYQWGTQKTVLKLKSNLEQAGYACWMDLGQMGGDKLFSKIDSGIRGAKVVICCMNTDYAESDNCLREVHLTISTGKPLIPLQMEKQTWPPEGALGPIMSEYLYIRFYDRKNNNPDAWPTDKFTELLGQIRYHVAPDPDMITKQYYNWFVPHIDNLIFLQPSSSSSSSSTTTTNNTKEKQPIPDDTPLVITHPQIMISYQWDNQKDIIKLYEKLTKLGYRCWLDIFQMGGGDSLFEKIDTGIRNAKCIISCVTPKYTKSINCRREMALSDALKKPIIPLLLEETTTWPPAGPMSMVFAEKSYIDFRRTDTDRGRWFGKEFELLLARLKQAIPEVETDKPQRHLLDMQRPTTAMKQEEKPTRIRSAPIIAQSSACSII